MAVKVAAMVALLVFASVPGYAQTIPVSPEMERRAIVSFGDETRLRDVFGRAESGEPVTIGFIGGSITQGAWASTPDRRYANLVTNWWKRRFPNSEVTSVNAGIGGTDSVYGAFRVHRDLLSKHPDFVIIEFSVNDAAPGVGLDSYEGVVRQVLNAPNHPAVLLLFLMNRAGQSVQDRHEKVGAYYDLPMISEANAVLPAIDAGEIAADSIAEDDVHPNDAGHRLIATLIDDYLDFVYEQTPPAMKEPLTNPSFTSTDIAEGAQFSPKSASGWTFRKDLQAWTTGTPGASLTFDFSGTSLFLFYEALQKVGGRMDVSIDEAPPRSVDTYFAQPWGDQRASGEVASGLAPGPHQVRITIASQANPQSTGHEVQLFGFGTTP